MAETKVAHVLVVEDEERSRRILTEALEGHGYYVTGVDSGERALLQLRRVQYDIVLLDIMMPGMDGFAVAREIRRDKDSAALPIVAVTALSDPGDAARVLEAGADAYISKPVDLSDVIDVVTDLLRAPPDTVGRYQLTRSLGEGATKRVFLARDTTLDRDVALALIRAEGLNEGSRLRVLREAQAMARLGAHPNIVTIYDFGEHDGVPYIVEEYMAGGDVHGLLRATDGPLPLARVLTIARDVARGLNVAHVAGIVHRDVKPANIWLTSDGTAKIGDFGIAFSLDRTRLTLDGGAMFLGTISYMPPEQVGGDATSRSDLYSLGVVVYEMATGRVPFVGDNALDVVTQHMKAAPVPPSELADCPFSLETLILRLLAKSPDDRPASAADVLRALDRINAVERAGDEAGDVRAAATLWRPDPARFLEGAKDAGPKTGR